MSDAGGRYQRSVTGMIGAMLVTVAVIAAYVAFREANRNDLDVERAPVDYLAVVQGIQSDGGLPVVYPPRLPEGWRATIVDQVPGEAWSLTMLTPQERFVGLRQATRSVDQMVATYVDEAATEGDPVRLDSPLATSWRTFTDDGGDYALVAEVEETVVLVVGTAEPEQIRELADSLVTARVG